MSADRLWLYYHAVSVSLSPTQSTLCEEALSIESFRGVGVWPPNKQSTVSEGAIREESGNIWATPPMCTDIPNTM